MSKSTIRFTVPLVPPSVNHYAKHTRKGRHYQTSAAMTFKAAVGLFAKCQYVTAKTFSVRIVVTLGEKKKGDVDNFPKLVLDGLAACGAFRHPNGKPLTDASVRQMLVCVNKEERPADGYTEITVEAL